MQLRKIIKIKDNSNLEKIIEKIEKSGGTVIKQLALIDSIVALLPKNTQKEISLLNLDEEIYDDVEVFLCEAGPKIKAAAQTIPWGIERVYAPEAWQVTRGKGAKVGIIDTGVTIKHPDLKIAGGVNVIYPGKSYADDHGHGTHIAGIIAAQANSYGVVGIAPEAEIFAIKALNSGGLGVVSDIIDGLNWCIENGIQIANISLNASEGSPPLAAAIKAAYDKGLVMVGSAGNFGPGENTVMYPAKYPEVIAVSSIDQYDNIGYYSCRGPEIDLASPGVGIYSTWKWNWYRNLSGTSMAAAHVTGVAALVLSIKGHMTPSNLKEHLRDSAESLDLSETAQGAGLVNAASSVL